MRARLKHAHDSGHEVMRFPGLSLREPIGGFTEAAYGRRLDFEHA